MRWWTTISSTSDYAETPDWPGWKHINELALDGGRTGMNATTVVGDQLFRVWAMGKSVGIQEIALITLDQERWDFETLVMFVLANGKEAHEKMLDVVARFPAYLVELML